MDSIKAAYAKWQQQGFEGGFYRIQWTVEDLMWNDIYACCKCFDTSKLNEYPKGIIGEEDK